MERDRPSNILSEEFRLYNSGTSDLFLPDDDTPVNGFVINCPDENIRRTDVLKLLRERR